MYEGEFGNIGKKILMAIHFQYFFSFNQKRFLFFFLRVGWTRRKKLNWSGLGSV